MAKILVVDDSPTQLTNLVKIVQGEGHEVITATNGMEGIEKARQEKPDLILMDVVMPELNGFQATRKITRDPDTEQIPVILVTTKDQETDKVWGQRQGAAGYIIKPPKEAELIAKIRETGARIRLIQDGDVSGVIAATQPEAGVDIFLGIGGAPQGVLAAAALRGVGGQMQGRLVFRNNDQRTEAQRLGIEDLERKYATEDMASGNVTFAATGVTYSDMLEGVRHVPGGAITHSMVLRSTTGTLRFIEGHHDFIRGTTKT